VFLSSSMIRLSKFDREFNTRRNTRFIRRGDKMKQTNDVGYPVHLLLSIYGITSE